MTNSKARRIALVACFASITLAPLAAHAQRKSPLEDAPAIRKRVELRESRFEIGPGFTSTITQDYYNTFMVGVRAAFHFNDWLSLAVNGNFAIANSETGYHDRLVQILPPNIMDPLPRDPTVAAAQGTMQKINSLLGAQLEFTPFTGKYSLFGKIFWHYDFYLFGGGGALDLKASDSALPACTSSGMTQSCAVSGFKPGGNVGVGMHTFFNNWLALNVELRDIIAQINPSGRDVNGDGFANSQDLSWGSTYFVTANLTVYLPYLASISQ